MKLLNVSIGLNPGTLALCAAAVILAPTVIGLAGGVLKGVTKAGIKGGFILYDKGKKLAGDTKKTV